MPKNKFKKGMRIRLTKMNDLQAPPIGTEGTVEFVDDAGQIHMFWDNGSRLALVPELDEFIVLGRYKVVYYENLAHFFYVDAENKEEAEEIFMRQIENGEYDFSDGEVIETGYEIKEE